MPSHLSWVKQCLCTSSANACTRQERATMRQRPIESQYARKAKSWEQRGVQLEGWFLLRKELEYGLGGHCNGNIVTLQMQLSRFFKLLRMLMEA